MGRVSILDTWIPDEAKDKYAFVYTDDSGIEGKSQEFDEMFNAVRSAKKFQKDMAIQGISMATRIVKV